MEPIVSVVVPTKNRYKYLKKLIDLIESFNNKDIELVVQDNSDNNTEIVDFLSERELKSTKYYYCTDKLSMSENADLAVKNSTGQYVCFIGDDDAVCRNIAECAHWMKQKGIDALRSLYVQYNWNESLGAAEGQLLYDSNLGFYYRELNADVELKRVLNKGAQGFINLPKLYQGIVSRKVVDELFTFGGSCFPGVTPDMSSAVTLCFFLKKYVMIDVPVVLPGRSAMVAGGVMGKVLTLDEVSFISDKHRKNWEEGFPKLWATELIWPDCAMKALRYVNHSDYIDKYFNKNRMLSQLVVMHRSYLKEALAYADGKLRFLLCFMKYIIFEGASFLWRKKVLFKITGKEDGKYKSVGGLAGINNAEQKLFDLLNDFEFKKLMNK